VTVRGCVDARSWKFKIFIIANKKREVATARQSSVFTAFTLAGLVGLETMFKTQRLCFKYICEQADYNNFPHLPKANRATTNNTL